MANHVFLKISRIYFFFILLLAGCAPTATALPPTRTPRPTVTRFPLTETPSLVPFSTATTAPSFTPTSVSNSIYVMFVVDASEKMNQPFDGKTKMDAARESIQAILGGLEPGANFGLVVIGGSSATEGVDVCNQPSVTRIPFSAQKTVSDQVSHLQPAGGGSMYSAFVLARRQFESLPANTVRFLIMITDKSDECLGQDEWKGMENLSKVLDQAGLEFHSEIIVLDEQEDSTLKSSSDRIGIWSKGKIGFQFPHNLSMLQETNQAVVGRAKGYADAIRAAFPTQTPEPAGFTLTPDLGLPTNTLSASSYTLTPIPGLETSTPGPSSYTLTPRPGTATFTPTVTLTPVPRTDTPTLTPTITRTPTPTQAPVVELVSSSYRTTGIGCQVDILVRVSGSPPTGSFHVLNSSNGPDGEVFQQVILPMGTYNGNIVSLSGNRPESYLHEVWFEYNGLQSNHLKNLKCPFVPTATPTP
jgi:hypothetical protein